MDFIFKKLNKNDISILIGNALEHYDTALYGVLAPILAPIFFPHKNQIISLILTYAVFATGFLTKPLGVILFSWIAKIKGPIVGLSWSIYGVALLTISIGFLPSFQKIGLLSPILLIMIKCFRSIFIAGETTISKLYLLSNKSKKNAFKNSIYYQTSTMVGIIMASAISSLIIFLKIDYLWRFSFFLGGSIGFVGIYLRKEKKLKTEKIEKTKDNKTNFIKLFWNNKLLIFRIAIANGFSYMTYIIPFVIMNTLIPMISNITINQMMMANTLFLVLDMFLIPLFGNYLINYSPIKIMLFASSMIAISIIPLWYFINSSFLYVCFFRIWIVFWGVIYLCPLNLWKYNLVKDKDNEKYLIVGLGSNLGAILVGKSMSSICFFIYYLSNDHIYIAFYILIICIVTLICIPNLRNN
ncbi:MAG: MFS transporter [Bacteroidetes bacterium]|nr:MFS transporter [Bacteroidota bacterium]